MDDGSEVVRGGRATVGRGPHALITVDGRRHSPKADASVAVRRWIRRDGAALLHRGMDYRRRWRARMSACRCPSKAWGSNQPPLPQEDECVRIRAIKGGRSEVKGDKRYNLTT